MLALPASSAFAETINVNSNVDLPLAVGANGCTVGPPSNVCTLRAAMQRASNNGDADDVIFVPANTYQLTLTSGASDPQEGDLDALAEPSSSSPESLTIAGPGARSTRIIGTGTDRVFQNGSTNLSLSIVGVTVSGGRGVTSGGGIIASGPLGLTDTAVVDNLAEASDNPAEGGGIHASGGASLANVTLFDNTASGTSGAGALGGAFYNDSGGSALLNVTISGNTAETDTGSASGGGIFNTIGTTIFFQNVTLAGNTTDGDAGGIFSGTGTNFRNTIVALNRTSGGAVSNCTPASPFTSFGNNLEETTECGFTGELQNTNPLLGALANNGGQTDTRALLAGSPAIDAANSTGCPAVDQRGVTRPQNGTCDIGAFEFAPTIIQPPPPPPPPPPPDDEALPRPRLGRTVNVREVSGQVFFAIPRRGSSAAGVRASQKGLRFRPLREARQLPVRSFLNTRRGSVRLVSARNRAGKTQRGVFSRGLFQILQSRKKRAKGLTTLALKGSSFRRCRTTGRRADASAAISRRRIRRLRARGRGRFRTRGRYSAATVRGTKWLTVDRCDGTLTKVTQGRVAVRDFRRKRTITLKRGKRYLAKARARR